MGECGRRNVNEVRSEPATLLAYPQGEAGEPPESPPPRIRAASQEEAVVEKPNDGWMETWLAREDKKRAREKEAKARAGRIACAVCATAVTHKPSDARRHAYSCQDVRPSPQPWPSKAVPRADPPLRVQRLRLRRRPARPPPPPPRQERPAAESPGRPRPLPSPVCGLFFFL